ncbi:hypothetical protein LINPERHAP1_LOCUS15471 [Linum perenne]
MKMIIMLRPSGGPGKYTTTTSPSLSGLQLSTKRKRSDQF